MRIHHVALRVADCERAASFYSGVLGLPEIRRSTEAGRVRSVWLAAGDTVVMLELSLRGGVPLAGSGHVLVFEVVGLGDWERCLAEAGIEIVDRTAHSLYASDPDGHRVGLTVFGKTTA